MAQNRPMRAAKKRVSPYIHKLQASLKQRPVSPLSGDRRRRSMECAAKGRGNPCVGPAVRPCARCGAVAYCSLPHQISHWSDHKEECQRLEEQMSHADELNDFPFTFCEEATYMICEKQETRCSFLEKRSLHRLGMWSHECCCAPSSIFRDRSRLIDNWHLPSTMSPCIAPLCITPKQLSSWEEYYEWRHIPLDSPVALLLHWPLTIYHAMQLISLDKMKSEKNEAINIHYLGPDKELSQLAVFRELKALFPRHKMHIELIGPRVPEYRVGERINLDHYAQCSDTACRCKENHEDIGLNNCNGQRQSVTLHFSKGFYHECFTDISKASFPDLIVAANAGIAAYPSWAPTIEMIKHLNVPAVFTDFCEEAAHLAAKCLSGITGCELRIPIQLNPFRQPMVVEGGALYLPCYSSCFLFGI